MKHATNIRIIPEDVRNRPARDLLIMGWDTADIAFSTRRTEAEVYNEISRERGLVVSAAPMRGFIDNHPIGQIAVGEYFSIPVKNRREHGSYIYHLKRKLGLRAHFQIAADDKDGNIRVIRVK